MCTTWTLESLQFTPVREKIKTGNCSFNGVLGAKHLSLSLKRQQAKQNSSFCKKCEVLASEMAWELRNWEFAYLEFCDLFSLHANVREKPSVSNWSTS